VRARDSHDQSPAESFRRRGSDRPGWPPRPSAMPLSDGPWSHGSSDREHRVDHALAPPEPQLPLTASMFRHLLDGVAGTLIRHRIAGVYGSTVSTRRNPGPTWISLTSPWAHGRLIRLGDGSSDCSAYRASDGRPLVTERCAITTAAQLDGLIALLSRPAEPVPRWPAPFR